MRPMFRLSMLVMAFAGFGAAQNSSVERNSSAANVPSPVQLPLCAVACLATAIQTTPCSQTDLQCQCTDTQFMSSSMQCVMRTCSVVDALFTQNVTQNMCGAPVRDRSIEYNVVSTTLLSLASVMVIIRVVYKRFFTTIELGLDDWFILLALLGAVPSAVINVALLSANGLGKDIWTLTPDMITEFAKAFYIVAILYFFEVFVLKLSLLFFYLRIFPGPALRRLLWGTVVFDILFGLAFLFTAIFQCTPISYNWTSWRGEGGGTCINISALAWSNAGISIGIDLWMLALPLFRLGQLQLNWKKKIGVAMMLIVGTFATLLSAIRLTALVQFGESSNITWEFWNVSIWSTVEITVAVICACMPSIRLIFVRLGPRVFTTLGGPTLGIPAVTGEHRLSRDRRRQPQPNFSRKPDFSRIDSSAASTSSSGTSHNNVIYSPPPSYTARADSGESMAENRIPPVQVDDPRPNTIVVSTRFSIRTRDRSPTHPIYDEFGGKSDWGSTAPTRRLA